MCAPVPTRSNTGSRSSSGDSGSTGADAAPVKLISAECSGLKVLATKIAEAKIVLMAPASPDAATATNAKLLAQFFPAGKIFSLPWLGKKISGGNVLKKTETRRNLGKLLSA